MVNPINILNNAPAEILELAEEENNSTICERIVSAFKNDEWDVMLDLINQIDATVPLNPSEIENLTTILPYAVWEGELEICRALLAKGAGLDHVVDEFNNTIGDVTALHVAAYRGDVEITRLLLRHAKQTNQLEDVVSHHCIHRCTPVLQALAEGQFPVIDVFIEEDAILYSEIEIEVDNPPNTTLFFSQVDFLEDTTLFHLSVLRGADNLTKYLIKDYSEHIQTVARCNLDRDKSFTEDNLPDIQGTPLHVACRLDQEEIVRLMAAKNRSALFVKDALSRQPIFYVALNGNFKLFIQMLCRMKCQLACDKYGNTPLHHIVRLNRFQFLRRVKAVIEQLLIRSVPIHFAQDTLDTEDRHGNTLLQTAAFLGFVEIVELLYDCRYVDINHRNHSKRTAYQLAAQNGHADVLEVLQRSAVLIIDNQTYGTSEYKRHQHELDKLEEADPDFIPISDDPELIAGLIEVSRSSPGLTAALFGTFLDESVNSSQNDDSDEGETAAHTVTRHDDPQAVGVMVKDARFSTHAKDAEGATVIKYANRNTRANKENSTIVYGQLRAKQIVDGSESSTGGSSSHSNKSQFSDDEGIRSSDDGFLSILDQTRASSPEGTESSDEDSSESSNETTTLTRHAAPSVGSTTAQTTPLTIQEKIDKLNEKLKENLFLDERIADEFCIAHFRGVNLNRKDFKPEERSARLAEDLAQEKIYCEMSHLNINSHYSKKPTPEQSIELERVTENIKKLWTSVLSRKHRISKWWDADNEQTFSRLRYAVQQRYTGCAGKNYGNGRYESTWDEIWSNIDLELQQMDLTVKGAERLVDSLKLTGNLFISAGKTPEHAVRYASGWSHASHKKGGRSDPRYSSTGRPKYPRVGIVYTFMHTLTEFMNTVKSDVCQLHRKCKINVIFKYLNETEVSFVGDIESENIAAVDKLVFPDFEREYDTDYHLRRFGLTREKYDDFKERFASTQRPQRNLIKILKSDYDEAYQTRYGIDQSTFNELKQFYTVISDTTIELTRVILKPFKKYFQKLSYKHVLNSKLPHATLLWELENYLEPYLINVARGDYDPDYERIYGLSIEKFEMFKFALTLIDRKKIDRARISADDFARIDPIFSSKKSDEYRAKLKKARAFNNDHLFKQAVADAFRGLNPYRRLKNELRHHFAGGTHPFLRNTNTNGFFAEKLFANAKDIAKSKGKTLVYLGADGRLYLPEETSREVKANVTKQAKEHPDDECLSSSDSEESDRSMRIDTPRSNPVSGEIKRQVIANKNNRSNKVPVPSAFSDKCADDPALNRPNKRTKTTEKKSVQKGQTSLENDLGFATFSQSASVEDKNLVVSHSGRVGIANPLSDCFIIATIQFLFRTSLRDFLRNSEHLLNPANAANLSLQKEIDGFFYKYAIESLQDSPDPRELKVTSMRRFKSQFLGSGQHDAEEFLQALIEPYNISSTSVRYEHTVVLDFVNKREEAGAETEVLEIEGEYSFNKIESDLIIRLQFPPSEHSAETASADFTQLLALWQDNSDRATNNRKFLFEGNSYSAPVLTDRRRLQSDNEFLLFQILRYTNGLKLYVKSHFNADLTFDFNTHTFRVVGFVVHLGPNLKQGHYFTYFKEGDEWYCFNDASVSLKTNEEAREVASNDAYLVYAERVDEQLAL